MASNQIMLAKTQMVTDYLLLAQAMRTAGESMNTYVAALANAPSHSDTVRLLIPPPNLSILVPSPHIKQPDNATVNIDGLNGAAANGKKGGKKAKDAAADDDEEEGEGATGKKRKRVTKPKDPNAPKRPPSAYLIYQNSLRTETKAQNPQFSNQEVLAKVAEAWKALSEEERKTYTDAATAEMNKWKEEHAAYKETPEGKAFDAKVEAEGEAAGEVKKIRKPRAPKAEKPASKSAPVPVNKESSVSTGGDDSEDEAAAAIVPQQAPSTGEDEEEDSSAEEAPAPPPAKKSKKTPKAPEPASAKKTPKKQK